MESFSQDVDSASVGSNVDSVTSAAQGDTSSITINHSDKADDVTKGTSDFNLQDTANYQPCNTDSASKVLQLSQQTHINSRQLENLPLPLTGMILCGGTSKRMGTPKAFLPYAGKSLIEYRLDAMKTLFSEVLLVTNEPELYEYLSASVVKDIIPWHGPFVGILSGLLVSSFEYSFVIPCDMPLLSNLVIHKMICQHNGADVLFYSYKNEVPSCAAGYRWVSPDTADLHSKEPTLGAWKADPLIGLYSKRCIEPLEESIFFLRDENNLDVFSKLSQQTYYAGREEILTLAPNFNVDTPLDYSKLCQL